MNQYESNGITINAENIFEAMKIYEKLFPNQAYHLKHKQYGTKLEKQNVDGILP